MHTHICTYNYMYVCDKQQISMYVHAYMHAHICTYIHRQANLLGHHHIQSALSVTAGRTETRTAPENVHMR